MSFSGQRLAYIVIEKNYFIIFAVLAVFSCYSLIMHLALVFMSDVLNCLKCIKASLEDPGGYLTSSLDFNGNRTEAGFICKLYGVRVL
jgi:hypothetical protein